MEEEAREAVALVSVSVESRNVKEGEDQDDQEKTF